MTKAGWSLRAALSATALLLALGACGKPEATNGSAPVPISNTPSAGETPKPPPPPTGDPAWNGIGVENGTNGQSSTGSLPIGGIALPDGYEIVSSVLLPTESYLPKADGMPTGVVLLDPRETARNEGLCGALLAERTATVRTETAARRDDPSGDYLVTHWLAKAQVGNEGDCRALIAAYDFERAGRIKATYGLGARRGPVVLALDATGEMVFLDLGGATREEVFAATSDWMRLALTAPQTGPEAGRPPRPPGLSAGVNRMFAKIASGFGTLARADTAPTQLRFSDPRTGAERAFTVYRSGVYSIGATFLL
jgi:hypothetical protein